MKNVARLGAVAMLALALGACAKQSDLDALRAEHVALQANHDLVVSQLKTWSMQVYDWENLTYNVICDIVAKNGPATKYDAMTIAYCEDTEGGGAPPAPPTWGDE